MSVSESPIADEAKVYGKTVYKSRKIRYNTDGRILPMRTRESEEMYLETILILKKRNGNVRSIDVVEELGYAKSSVSRGVNLLHKKGYIEFDESGSIRLTAAGEKKASAIYERHLVITQALVKIGADKALAEQNACRIEHVITQDLFDIIKKFAAES